MGLIRHSSSVHELIIHHIPYYGYKAFCGPCGEKDYYYFIQEEGDKLYLRKYQFPLTYLGRSLLYDPGGAQIASLGAGTIVGKRFYFFNQHTKKVEWFELKDHFEDLPQRTPILSIGEGDNDLHFYNKTPKVWSVTSYKDRYLFHCDGKACRIIVTDLDGNYKGKFGEYGSLDGQFNYPTHCAVYHSPIHGDVLFVADIENKRISVWKIRSIEPFDIVFLRNGVIGLSYKPQGIGIWRNQLYILGEKNEVGGYVIEFKIEDDCSLTATGVKGQVRARWENIYYGVGLYIYNNSLVAVRHFIADDFNREIYFNWSIFRITPIENTLIVDFKFKGFSVVKGIWHTLPFSIFAGQIGVWKGFKFKGEGYAPSAPVINVKFKFSCSAKHDIYAMIQSFGFDVIAEQRMIREFIPFSFLGHSNFVRGNIEFSIDMDIIITEFLTGENVFNFKMIANAPLVYTCHLDTKPIELEGELINSSFVSCSLELPSLEIVIRESLAGSVDLPAIDIFGEIEVPVVGNVGLNLARLQSSGQIVNPFFVGGQAIVPTMKVSGLIYRPDLISGNLIFRALQTNGIGYASLDRLDICCILNELQMNSEILVNPVLVGECELALFEVRAVERKEISSTEEIYQNDELNVVSAEYPEVEGRELLGVAVNLLNKGITKLANTSNMVIDLGYIDLHKSVINQYLEVFISGKSDQPAIGELIIGDYSYSIDEWVTEGEWRILVGKGLTRRTASNPDKRYIPIKLKLVSGFELKSVVVKAIPVARRGR